MADVTRVDYDQLKEIAGRFSNQANLYEGLTRQTRGYVDELHNNGWIGRGSDAFFSEMQDLVIPAMERLRQALEEAGQMTNVIAEIFGAAEQDAQGNFSSIGE